MNTLIIGDSHAEGAFGKALRDELAAAGHNVTLAGVGSTAIRTWVNKNPVCHVDGTHCLDQDTLPHSPDLLILVLGTNDAANAVKAGGNLAKQADDNVAKLKKLIAKYAPAQAFWVGPPWMRDTSPYYTNAGEAELYDAADRAGVPIFDSRPVTKPLVEAGSGDGIHLGSKGAKTWAKAVAAAIASPPADNAAPDADTGAGSSTADDSDDFNPLWLLLIAVVGGALLAKKLRR